MLSSVFFISFQNQQKLATYTTCLNLHKLITRSTMRGSIRNSKKTIKKTVHQCFIQCPIDLNLVHLTPIWLSVFSCIFILWLKQDRVQESMWWMRFEPTTIQLWVEFANHLSGLLPHWSFVDKMYLISLLKIRDNRLCDILTFSSLTTFFVSISRLF